MVVPFLGDMDRMFHISALEQSLRSYKGNSERAHRCMTGLPGVCRWGPPIYQPPPTEATGAAAANVDASALLDSQAG